MSDQPMKRMVRDPETAYWRFRELDLRRPKRGSRWAKMERRRAEVESQRTFTESGICLAATTLDNLKNSPSLSGP